MSGNAQSRAALDSMEQKGLRFFGDVVDELSKDRRVSIIHMNLVLNTLTHNSFYRHLTVQLFA